MREWKIRESVQPHVNMILECDGDIIMIYHKNDSKWQEIAEFIRDACNAAEQLISSPNIDSVS